MTVSNLMKMAYSFKFDENGIKFFELVENTVVKGEIARYEQFHLSHSVFKRLILQTRKRPGLVGERVKKTEKGDLKTL